MQASLILWFAYLRMIGNYIKRRPLQCLGGLGFFSFLIYHFINNKLRLPAETNPGDIIRDSVTFGIFAGAVLFPNSRMYDKDRPLLELLQTRAVVRMLTAQKILLSTLFSLLVLFFYYRGQTLNWSYFLGSGLLAMLAVGLIRRTFTQRASSKTWATGLRDLYVSIWPISRESKAYLRVQIFSHWSSYKTLMSAFYFMGISLIGAVVGFTFADHPKVTWQPLIPLLPFYFAIVMNPPDDVESLPLLQTRWKAAVFHGEWIRWATLWILSFAALTLALLAAPVEFNYPILTFLGGSFLGFWLAVWASYLRVRFSRTWLLRTILGSLSAVFPFLIPIIVTTEKKQ